jgi:hypothetical protein
MMAQIQDGLLVLATVGNAWLLWRNRKRWASTVRIASATSLSASQLLVNAKRIFDAASTDKDYEVCDSCHKIVTRHIEHICIGCASKLPVLSKE